MSGTKVEPLELPEAVGAVVTLSEKVYVPVKEHPDVSRFHFTLLPFIGLLVSFL